MMADAIGGCLRNAPITGGAPEDGWGMTTDYYYGGYGQMSDAIHPKKTVITYQYQSDVNNNYVYRIYTGAKTTPSEMSPPFSSSTSAGLGIMRFVESTGLTYYFSMFAGIVAILAGLINILNAFSDKFPVSLSIPRILAAILVGAALSTAGAAYQGMFQNPLVSPDILGASAGAGLGAALAIYFYLGTGMITIFAFAGGLVAVGIVYAISRLTKGYAILSMVLAGILVDSLFSASTSYIKLVADTNDQLPAITYWLMGSLSGTTMEDVYFAGVIIILGLIPLCLLRWRMNVLTLGEDEAKSMGINTNLLRLIVIVCATLITAVAVSISGLIGWVGLVIPHFCRMIFGYDYRKIIPAAIVMGGGFLLLVDDFARTVATVEVPLGILTAFVGAPIFAYLLMIRGKQS